MTIVESSKGASYIVCYLAVFLACVSPVQLTGRCLKDVPEVNPKKYLHYENQSLNIILETSTRLTHALTTQVFKIFLQEVLGYPKVIVKVEEGDHFQVLEVIERLSGSTTEMKRIPDSMINLEVWVPAETDVIPITDARYVTDGGNVAPAGRFGWFIPNELTAPLMIDGKMHDIHWNKLKDRNFVRFFDITGQDLEYVIRNTYEMEKEDKKFRKRFFCEAAECENGIFTPNHCKNVSVFCGYLLTSHYIDTSFVIKHINELELHFRVLFVGHNLRQVATYLQDRYISRRDTKSLFILSWTPSDVILDESNYTSVLFPRCELLNSDSTLSCKYELMRLAKFSWSKLKQFAEPAYNAVHKFKFEKEHYESLLNLHMRNESVPVDVTACTWLKENQKYWWVWKEVEKSVFYLGGIFPITGSAYKGKGISKAAVMAAKAINANKNILPNHQLELLVADGQCRADKVMRAFIDYIVENYYQKLIGVLGPACSETIEPLVGVSKHYDTVVISYSAEGSSFSDRDKYPYFFRTIGENKQYKHVYLKMFKKFGWKRFAALTEDGQKYTEYISHMQEYLDQNNVSLISNTKFPRERETVAMRRYLEDLKKKTARVIIADVYDDVARTVMCEAYKLSMTAAHGYVWFLPQWLNETFYNTTFWNKARNESVSCTTQEMLQAVNGYFAVTHAFYAADDAIMQENRTVGEWRKEYNQMTNKVGGPSDYGGFAYDAVWAYAYALDKLTKLEPEAHSQIHSKEITKKFVQLIQDSDFYGVSGKIRFWNSPSRITNINIIQWYNKEKYVVGQFVPKVKSDTGKIIDGYLNFTNFTEIKWFTANRMPPDDGSVELSVCALQNFAELLGVECDMAIIILNLIGAAILIFVLFTMVYVIKKKYDKKVQLTKKFMKHWGIDVTDANAADLDKWEIAREAVCINRKLGEGAFGTVYGGEANIPNSGWLPVAVKTLKIGSTTEEKLDFLSEAEVMKRFDHKNIIKLLGVCTKNEPVYTIMEFMLYGDLKTFLLGRRHLVTEKSEESEEISSKKLTNMALDVARGLSYLADLKYVHRDIACRNCLINAQRLVKLADFGMTRPMFENDYYKFNRKGMLPVRWMSPESLGLGVFTPSSDVWSYGVLLYEIITFGSFPFQGMSNSEVLEAVKKGNTLQIPTGVKPQLEGLLKSCWNLDAKMRPTAKEIVEFLANNPRLLFPCLDVPLASVQMEDTSQLEIQLPFRKSSSFSLKPSDTSTVPNGFTTPLRQAPTFPMPKRASLQKDLEEPLLGNIRPASSSLNRYMTVQYNKKDDGEQNDQYCSTSPPTERINIQM